MHCTKVFVMLSFAFGVFAALGEDFTVLSTVQTDPKVEAKPKLWTGINLTKDQAISVDHWLKIEASMKPLVRSYVDLAQKQLIIQNAAGPITEDQLKEVGQFVRVKKFARNPVR